MTTTLTMVPLQWIKPREGYKGECEQHWGSAYDESGDPDAESER